MEVAGWKHHATACNTALADGMEIQSHSPAIEDVRRTLLRLLAENYPAEAVRQFPEKQFHRYLTQYGVSPPRQRASSSFVRPSAPDRSHPYIRVDMAQCVTCFRCVAICDQVQGQFVWRVWNRVTPRRFVPIRAQRCAKARASVAAPVSILVRAARLRTRPCSIAASRKNGRARPVPIAALVVR